MEEYSNRVSAHITSQATVNANTSASNEVSVLKDSRAINHKTVKYEPRKTLPTAINAAIRMLGIVRLVPTLSIILTILTNITAPITTATCSNKIIKVAQSKAPNTATPKPARMPLNKPLGACLYSSLALRPQLGTSLTHSGQSNNGVSFTNVTKKWLFPLAFARMRVTNIIS